MKNYFLTMARYNLWATRKLYEHVDALSDDDYRRDAGLFFKSVHGTLNHLLLAEQWVWFPRFAESVSNRIALNQELETDRIRLRERLIDGTQQWLPFIDTLDASRFDGRLDYVSTNGVARSLPFSLALGHVFNHGTHHRGQITAMGHACPEIDLVWMLHQQGSAS